MKRFILFACAVPALALMVGCKGSEPMAAIVNGESITLADYHKYLELKPQVQTIVNPSALQATSSGQLPQQPYNGQVVGSLGLQALNDMIQQAILRQLAKDENVYPSADEIKAELDDRTKNNPNFVRDLTNAGFTLEMIRSDIALQLAQYKLTTQGITVTDEQVTKYITEHPKEFVEPPSVDMVWMLVPDEKTKKLADADVKSGNTFIYVAQKYTVAPNARAMQYRFPERYIPRLVNYGPDLMPAVQKTKEQAQTDWIKFTEGWAKFYINKKSPERKLPIDDVMRKRVSRALALQMGAQGKDVNKRVQDRLKSAKIEIAIPHLKEPWKRSMESLAPNTAPAPSTKPEETKTTP